MNYICPTPIAILLAVYNGEKYLAEQLDSVIRQTCPEWTLYIRNDGSTDNTRQIIDSYVERYPGKIVEIDRGGSNLGCSGNFYRLLEVVDSKYYMFCDGDDVWFDDKIEVSLSTIREEEKKYPDTPIMAFGDTVVCDSEMNVVEPSYWKSVGINPEKFLSYNYMAICCTAGGSCTIFNQGVRNAVIPWVDNGTLYDYWIALVVAQIGRFKVIHRPLKYYRQHNNQVSSVSYGKQNSISYKFWNLGKLLKQYRWEAQLHKDIGYGPKIKYYWYKFMTILKIRFSNYH